MKYIRTKDGVYKVTYDGLCYKEAKSQTMLMLVEHKNEKGKIEYKEITTHKELAMGKHRFKEHIINQADTIEELCDEWVCWNRITDKRIVISIKTYEEIINSFWFEIKEKQYIFYGAIWVLDSNGTPTLKPVAKMNDKGDLELL